jgi:hypothetical protein
MFFSVYRDGQCQEHHVNEQAICAVGLDRAKPVIFVEAIQYILVIATPVEVRMLASYSFDNTRAYQICIKPIEYFMLRLAVQSMPRRTIALESLRSMVYSSILLFHFIIL